MDNETERFIYELLAKVCDRLGVTGTVLNVGSIQPGALEVLSDALLSNHFGGDGPGVATALSDISSSIDDLAEAVTKVARAIEERP